MLGILAHRNIALAAPRPRCLSSNANLSTALDKALVGIRHPAGLQTGGYLDPEADGDTAVEDGAGGQIDS